MAGIMKSQRKFLSMSTKFRVFTYNSICETPEKFEFGDLEEAKKAPFNYMREIQLVINNSDNSETRMIVERISRMYPDRQTNWKKYRN